MVELVSKTWVFFNQDEYFHQKWLLKSVERQFLLSPGNTQIMDFVVVVVNKTSSWVFDTLSSACELGECSARARAVVSKWQETAALVGKG